MGLSHMTLKRKLNASAYGCDRSSISKTNNWPHNRAPANCSAATFSSSILKVYMLSDIALFITAIGVLGVVYGLRQAYRQRLRQFEEQYVQRYWALLDKFSLEVLKGSSIEQIGPDDEKAIRSYFFLCEDELEDA
jgi:hypothetical protein